MTHWQQLHTMSFLLWASKDYPSRLLKILIGYGYASDLIVIDRWIEKMNECLEECGGVD